MDILIYTPIVTNRIRYIFNFIFKDILLAKPSFTSNRDEFIASEGVKLSYCEQALADEIFFKSSPLLYEKGIEGRNNDYNLLKKDFFSLAFFLLSRYEEYLPHHRDVNDRYDVHESLAFRHKFLNRPEINITALQIRGELEKKYPSAKFPDQQYKFIPTIDVDNAYAFREKGFVRTFGAYSRSLLRFNFEDISERTSVLLGKEHDPYDVFDYLTGIQKKYNLKPIYFFLVADYGLNDKNVPYTSKKFQSLIKSVSDYAEVGIHPSYNSSEDKVKLKSEISRLSMVLHKDITKSRQHFLKIHLPETYRNLLQLGITDDYTMGYASEPGFRAGTCTPFNFFDLKNDTETSLKIHPFCLMEATLKYYRDIHPETALDFMKPIIDEVKKVRGTLYSLWHNEFLSDIKEFKGWKKVFENMVEYAI